MIIEVEPLGQHYVVTTDSLENPKDRISLVVFPEADIAGIVKTLSEMRGRPK